MIDNVSPSSVKKFVCSVPIQAGYHALSTMVMKQPSNSQPVAARIRHHAVKQGTSGFVVRPFACGYQRQYAPISCENDKSDGMLVIHVEWFMLPRPRTGMKRVSTFRRADWARQGAVSCRIL